MGDPAPAVDAEEEAVDRTLRRSIHRVASASALAVVVGELVTFVQTIALARLLSPAQVGVFVAGTVLTTLLVNFAEGGLRAGLIHRETDLADAAETVFWVTLVTGAAMSLAALALASVIGKVFADRTIGQVAAVSSGLLFINGLTNVPEALLQREFNVRRRLVVGPLVSVTYAAVAVVLAAAGWGVWAMVTGLYASQLASLIAVWLITTWRPGRGRASIKLWRELARYGLPLVVGLLGARTRASAEAVVVGRGLSAGALGSFRYGQRIARIPTNAIIEIGSNSLFPAFSRLSRDPQRTAAAYVRALHWAMLPASATAGLLVALGEPAVVVLFGEPWRHAGVALVFMSGMSIGYALICVSEEVIKGSGRTKLLNWLTASDLLIGAGLLVLLVLWQGLIGAALSLALSAIIIGMIMVALARRVTVASLRDIAVAVVSPLPSALVASVAVWLLEHQVMHSDRQPILIGIGSLGLDTLAYALVFLAVLWVFARPTVTSLLRAGLGIARRIRRTSAVPAR